MQLSGDSATAPRERASLRDMHPAYFAMVMATGIISTACYLLGFHFLSVFLFWLNIGFFIIICALTLLRLVLYPGRLGSDLISHSRGLAFFTSVAATCVLGSQVLVVSGHYAVAAGLWLTGIALWVILTYTVFTALTVRAAKPSLAEGINGGWLTAVVAAQSIAVLGAQLMPYLTRYQQPVLFFSLAVWLGGGMLYIWIIGLIFYRYTFFPMEPSELSPPYWINMGAVAISTLAGTMLALDAERSVLVAELLPFIKGFTLMFWATATWWIPMLVILGVWRHVYCRYTLRYDPLYWGAVFPLGMYTACTFRLAKVLGLDFLLALPRGFIYVALGAWCLTFVGLLINLASALTGTRSGSPGGTHPPRGSSAVPRNSAGRV